MDKGHALHEMPKICSLYWDNVDRRIVDAQKAVFSHFGFEIEQQRRDGLRHALWMETILNEAAPDQVVLLVDIDCIPLNSEIVRTAIACARDGNIFGCAQSAAHLSASEEIYAGPMFLALTGATWRRLDSPSLKADKQFDVGGRLSAAAKEQGIPVSVLFPSAVAIPKWPLGSKGLFGLFTVYEDSVLHIFESRQNHFVECFKNVSEDILSGSLDIRRRVIEAATKSRISSNNKLRWRNKGKLKRKYKKIWNNIFQRAAGRA